VRKIILMIAVVSALSGIGAGAAAASHAWGNYHWARTANPFSVPLGDNVTNTAYSNWDGALSAASVHPFEFDWSDSSVLDSPVTPGQAGNPKRCAAVNGRIEVCNAAYGPNGWLGLAQIWTSGSHIVKSTSKMNDTYFNSTRYSYTAERHVMCQEIGHGYGLGHQDESGADLNTCMDYASQLDNATPNDHDYKQLETIYGHTDSTSTVTSTSATKGVVVHRSDRMHHSYIVEDLGRGHLLHTFITWSSPRASH
jgi:hypothetical protein